MRGFSPALVLVVAAAAMPATAEAAPPAPSAVTIERIVAVVGHEVIVHLETGLGHFNVPGAIYREDAFELGRLRMNAWYYDHGMIDTNVSAEELTLSDDHASLSIVIDVAEGPVYRVGEVHCTGDLADGEASCLELLGARTGGVFSRAAMMRGIERVRVQQATKGHGTQIEPQTVLDPAKKTLGLRTTIGS